MADTPELPKPKAPGKPGAGGDELTKKIGPFPIWAWIALALIFVYLLYRNGVIGGSSKKTTGTAASSTANQNAATATQAGEQVDPVTGYLQGSAADVAALSSMYDLTAAGVGGNAGAPATGSTPTYSTNSAWGSAAVSYLVGLGETQSQASKAVNNYLGSVTLTGQQQAMVNSAISDLGPAPNQPAPSTATSSNDNSGQQKKRPPVHSKSQSWQPHDPSTGGHSSGSTPGGPQPPMHPGGGDNDSGGNSGGDRWNPPSAPSMPSTGKSKGGNPRRGNPGGPNQAQTIASAARDSYGNSTTIGQAAPWQGPPSVNGGGEVQSGTTRSTFRSGAPGGRSGKGSAGGTPSQGGFGGDGSS